jgi:uncharacterized protein YbdZ (MbtH family)
MSWADSDSDDKILYKVVINHEEQYSIWPADRENPAGWMNTGKAGPKNECLAYIKDIWTDMRPLSLKRLMAQQAAHRALHSTPPSSVRMELPKDGLVGRLSQADHPVELSLRPEKSIAVLKESLELGYVFIKFTDTKGETELGVRLNRESTDLSRADFDNQTGTIHLEGELTINKTKVRCRADLFLDEFKGRGHLEPIMAEKNF